MSISASEQFQELSASVAYKYHAATKHTVEKLLAGGFYLDWANQPAPFRHYLDAPQLELSRRIHYNPQSLFQVLETANLRRTRQSDLAERAEMPGATFVSSLLFYSLAISAWKQIKLTSDKWALRCNASSGNLHPTEAHLYLREIEGFEPGLYHYRPDVHGLELRARAADLALPSRFESAPAVIFLTSIHWREIWKYRERGFRYCQHDMGHALAAVEAAARSLGGATGVSGLFPDREIRHFLGLEASDEVVSLMVALSPPMSLSKSPSPLNSGDRLKNAFELPGRPDSGARDETNTKQAETRRRFFGVPNTLSDEVRHYPDVSQAYQATCLEARGAAEAEERVSEFISSGRVSSPGHRLEQIEEIDARYDSDLLQRIPVESVNGVIRRRRSAVDMDYRRSMSLPDLTIMLSMASRGFAADFQTLIDVDENGAGGLNLIHLYVYVHRVSSLRSGLYYYDRYRQRLAQLIDRDMREIAKGVSCFQDIAADSCVTLSMVADFNTAFELFGDRGYRLIHYEAGYIGQFLYLISTALGYDSTGIGCFVDDAINTLLDLKPGYEVIYNFCTGGALIDPRLTTLPAYDFPEPPQE